MLRVSGQRTVKSALHDDQQTLKPIVDPFLTWYNSQFDHCLEDIKKYPDYASLVEESLNDGGFQIDEQTLYNILSAELQNDSKAQSINTYRTLPTIPQCIANATNLHKKTYAYKLTEHVRSSRRDKRKNYTLTPDDFVHTEQLCKTMNHFKIVDEYFKSISA